MIKKFFRNPMRRWGWLFLGPVTAAFIIGFVWPFCQGIFLPYGTAEEDETFARRTGGFGSTGSD